MNNRQEMWSWVIILWVAAVILLAGYVEARPQAQESQWPPTPSLQRHLLPPSLLAEESCRDHLQRLQNSFLQLALPHGRLWQIDHQFARKITIEARAIHPSQVGPMSAECGKRELQRLDIIEGLLLFEVSEHSEVMAVGRP